MNLPQISSPTVQDMVLKYGHYSVTQFGLWVKNYDFPNTGNITLNQLKQLKIKLLVEQERSKEEQDTGRDVELFVPDWRAFECWLTEVNIRDSIQKEVTEIISRYQSLQIGSDLDTFPLRGRSLQTEQASASNVPIDTSRIQLCCGGEGEQAFSFHHFACGRCANFTGTLKAAQPNAWKSQARGRERGRGRDGTCFICAEAGHWARNCPENPHNSVTDQQLSWEQ